MVGRYLPQQLVVRLTVPLAKRQNVSDSEQSFSHDMMKNTNLNVPLMS